MVEYVYNTLAAIGYLHPIHPTIIHVPIGLIMGAFVFGFLARFFHRPGYYQTAHRCMVLAFVALVPTIVFGYADWQHSFGGARLFEIRIKIILSAALVVIVLVAAFMGRKRARENRAVLIPYTLAVAVVVCIGYFGGELVYGKKTPINETDNVRIAEGAVLFSQACAMCHFTENTDTKVGPGLKGIFLQKNLPVSGWEMNEENLRKQIKTPFADMPPYADLSENELSALMVYLKTI